MLPFDISRDEDPTGDIRHRIARGYQLLLRHHPAAAMRAKRTLKPIWLIDARTAPTLLGRRRLVLGRHFAEDASPEALALVLSFAIIRTRLHRFSHRLTSADRRAQYWRRVHREVAHVAQRIDQAEDAGGYIPGISQGRWEQWTEDWLGSRALRTHSLARRMRGATREFRLLGIPKWLRRVLVVVIAWRGRQEGL